MRKTPLAALALLLHATLAVAIDANHASEAELDGVKGLGPGSTRVILQERNRAPFRDWADFIARVKGLGPARATALSEAGLTVDGRPYEPAPVPRSAAAASPARK
jgi:competence protein ComEA